jgi:hypothetical protein
MSIELKKLKKQLRSISTENRYKLIAEAVDHLPEEIQRKIPSIPREQPEDIFNLIPPEIIKLVVEKINELQMSKILASIVVRQK